MKLTLSEFTRFFTATNLEWKKLLKPLKYKEVVLDSLRYLTKNGRVKIYAFVIMDNHIHLIWQMINGNLEAHVQRDFLKFTAQQIKKDLKDNHPLVLELFKVNAKDREYQFWERNPLSVEIWTEKVFKQKMDYIHNNPVKAGICNSPEDYKYSSAKFYATGIDEWGFLTHYQD